MRVTVTLKKTKKAPSRTKRKKGEGLPVLEEKIWLQTTKGKSKRPNAKNKGKASAITSNSNAKGKTGTAMPGQSSLAQSGVGDKSGKRIPHKT